MPLPALVPELSLVGPDSYDALVVVTPDVAALPFDFADALRTAQTVDASVGKSGSVAVVAVPVGSAAAYASRVVVAGAPKLSDFDDVRAVGDVAADAVKRAVTAGASAPLLVFSPAEAFAAAHPNYLSAALLAITQALYEPLQARESEGEDIESVSKIGFLVESLESGQVIARTVSAIESGRRLARDVGGSDPERMTPEACARYIEASLEGLGVQVSILDDIDKIRSDFPLAYAVARGSLPVQRHHPRIVTLEYNGEGPIEETLLFSGKGIVYDTGGADIKTGGIMAGMHMDKGGACNIAGFVKTAALLKPKGIRIVAMLGFVRNSCGSDSYVADEVIRSHAGARVLVLNTDAEGRMVLSDMLSHLRVRASTDAAAHPNAHLFTCATLTGHAARSVGPYTIAMDNGPALSNGVAQSLQQSGTQWGDPIEVSVLRREDFQWAKPKTKKADVLQMGSASPAGARGHQFGASFLILSSGMDKHGNDSEQPLRYTHLDIAGSACEGSEYKFGKPTGTPIIGLTSRFVLGRV